MSLKIYNTLSGTKEDFIPIEEGKVRMYVCGPTVYDYFHIGNARPFIFFDVVKRYLKYKGYKVTLVQNITDIDDKIINKAKEEGISAEAIAEKYTKAYITDKKAIGVEEADRNPKVTEHIEDIIKAIKKLEDKGYTYTIGGDVYFRVKSFKEYGKLSHQKINGLLSGARVEVDDRKESPLDFALWKSIKGGEPYWVSPWGNGRPGWHIECSVMSTKYLGETFDIHGGGSDLIFPHHENEIALAESITDKPFVKYWMHNGFLTIKGEKASKSLKNITTIRELLNVYKPEILKFFILSAHYKNPLNYTENSLNEANESYKRIQNTYVNAKKLLKEANDTISNVALDEKNKETKNKFIEMMDDDFNTAGAFGYLFELIYEMNLFISNYNKSKKGIKSLLNSVLLLEELCATLGLKLGVEENRDLSKELIEILIDIRNIARSRKYWDIADIIRDDLISIGVVIEDKKCAFLSKNKKLIVIDNVEERSVELIPEDKEKIVLSYRDIYEKREECSQVFNGYENYDIYNNKDKLVQNIYVALNLNKNYYTKG